MKLRRSFFVIFLAGIINAFVPSFVFSCTSYERLQSVLWVQTSGEYEAATLQVYQLAKSRLDMALGNSNWSAAIEQLEKFSHLPPAIIVDVDETVLDNSPFQARLLKLNCDRKPHMWQNWVREAKARPIQGALDFLRYASSREVEIFYVTNRDHSLEKATKNNLERFGFPLKKESDNILMRNEQADWAADKGSRRMFLAKSYRILLIIGDDLNDFVSTTKFQPESRTEVVEKKGSMWGNKWIILPNPVYGSWEKYLFNSTPPQKESEKLSIKLKKLETLN